MDKALEFLKQNLKVTLTVSVLGLGVTLGWFKGCTVDTNTETPAAVAPVAAPAVP